LCYIPPTYLPTLPTYAIKHAHVSVDLLTVGYILSLQTSDIVFPFRLLFLSKRDEKETRERGHNHPCFRSLAATGTPHPLGIGVAIDVIGLFFFINIFLYSLLFLFPFLTLFLPFPLFYFLRLALLYCSLGGLSSNFPSLVVYGGSIFGCWRRYMWLGSLKWERRAGAGDGLGRSAA